MNPSLEIHQHRFESVESYLHHRPPYLMVDEVIGIESESIETAKELTGEEFFFAGHFPWAPIVPGAMQQEFVTQSAGILIAANYNPMREFNTSDPTFNEFALGVLVRVKQARYRGFVRPGDRLTARVEMVSQLSNLFEFNAHVLCLDRRIAELSFQLANIESSELIGRP